jgi:L-fucose isomerase-like protein
MKSRDEKLPAHFGYIPVATILQKYELDSLIGDYIPALKEYGGQQWDAGMISNPLPLFFFVVTGSTEQTVLELREKRTGVVLKEPVFLLAHPGNNSLPGALEVLARLQQDGQKGKIFYIKGPDDKAGLHEVEEAVSDLKAFHSLQQARIGLVGTPSDWLVASSPDPALIREVWGPEVVPIDFEELKGSIRSISDSAIQLFLDPLISKATKVAEPSERELEEAVRVSVTLKQLVEKHHLHAMTVRCFDLVLQLKTTGCFALAQLNDEGIIAGCEGDLLSTVGMLWISELLNQSSWMANPAQIDIEHNILLLAHCTVPQSMLEGYQLRSHFESGLGVGIQGTLPIGPVTLFRIGGKKLEKLWLAEGEILPAGHIENLCRTQAKVRLTQGAHVKNLLKTPLGNHLVLVRGKHADRLRSWWETFISCPERR